MDEHVSIFYSVSLVVKTLCTMAFCVLCVISKAIRNQKKAISLVSPPKINQITGNLVQTFSRCMEPPYRIGRLKEMLREHMLGYVPALFLLQNTLKWQFSM